MIEQSIRDEIVELLLEYGNNDEYPGDLPDHILAIPRLQEALNPQARPFDASDGGAKVLGAIKEVLDHKGSVEVALKHGEAALRDLYPPTPTNLGHSISTNTKG